MKSEIKRTMRVIVLLVVALSTSPVWASSERSGDTHAPLAQEHLNFRIVIPATLQFDSQVEQHKNAITFVSRTMQVQGNGMVVTVAKP